MNYTINWDNQTSLYNWVEQLDLICVDKEHIGLIGSVYFMGWTTTCLVVPPPADRYGRRLIFLGCITLLLVSYAWLMFTHNINVTISMMYLQGFITSGRITVGYVYMQEFMTPKWRVVIGATWNVFDGLTYLFMTIYFGWIDKHYFWYCMIGFWFATFTVCVGLLFIPESPLWLLKVGRFDQAKLAIKKIVKFNGFDAAD
jgi:MFS family permease